MYDEIHVWMVDGNDWDKILSSEKGSDVCVVTLPTQKKTASYR